MSKWQYILALLVTVGFFGIMALILFTDIQISEQFEKPLNLLIGALISQFTTIISYFYGSSKGSADKTALLKK